VYSRYTSENWGYQAPEELHERVIEYFELPKDSTLSMAEAVL
jgi:hypothetical protein